jgi:hypothetical protein
LENVESHIWFYFSLLNVKITDKSFYQPDESISIMDEVWSR